MNSIQFGKLPFESVFLLGGHDLEMAEIRKILDEQKVRYLDYNLEWGACLSAYQNVLNNKDYFIGVELYKDIQIPKYYFEIDHHNENVHKTSSIEQVAELFSIKLNRWQQLVAANDSGYIPAMKVLGATKTEIDSIRKADRKEQGVTEEDERLSVESIRNHQQIISGVKVIFSLSNKFSPITDLLYPFEELIVCNNLSLVYYGSKTIELSSQFKNLIEKGKAYTGGGSNGYFGFTESGIQQYTNAESLVTLIIKTIQNGA